MNPQDTPNSIPNTPELSSGGEKWLSMSEAALHTPYSSEYLSLLARKGKLTAKKINDVWYTTKSILDEYMQRQMLREQVQNGNAPAPNGASAAPDATGNAPIQASSEISLQNLPTSTVLKPIRSYADDHQEYIARQSVSAMIPKVAAASGAHASTIENIEHALERVLEKKLSRPEPMRRLSLSLPGVSSLGRGLLALMLTGIVLFTVMPVPFVFSFFEKSYDAVKGVIGDARTVMGFRPGTHANELLLLDKSGNVSIMGHLESHVTDGSAPIVVDSTTQVNNLNADYVNGLHASDFTLAYVTKNGNVTTEDVKLDGRVEVGKTLIVSGITNLNDVTVLGDAEFKQILKVLGPAYFADVVTAESDLNTKGNLKVSKNISVRGSVNAGGAVIGDSGTFSNVNVSDTISAVVGKFESLIASDISASALTSASSTLADVRISTLAADVSVLSKLTFGNATGTSATTTNFFATTASTTNLFAQVFTAGSLNSPGLNSFGNVLVNGSSTLQDFTFLHATGTSATTTTFFATTGSFTNLVGGTQTLSNLIFTLATGTSATTTNSFATTASSTNLFFTTGNGGDITSSGLGTFANLFAIGSTTLRAFSFTSATGTAATTTNFFATTASSTNLFATSLNSGNVTSTGLGTFANILATGSTTLQNLSFVLATGTSATTTNFFATTASSTNLYAASLAAGSITGANILANSSTTLQNFTGLNSTSTNATSTAHFATTASSTNLFSANATLGVVSIATSTIASLNIGSATTSRLAINSLTAGSVPFIGAGGLVTQNNGQLFWDNSQTFLGIGITNPTQKLQVSGGIALFDSASVGAGANTTSGIRIVAPISSSHFNWMIGAQQNVSGGFEITPSTATGGTTFSTPSLTVLASTGNVGIGTTNPTTGRLAVLQGTNSSTGGVSVTNSGSGGALYAWTDASNIARIDSQSNASGNISLNGSGTGNVGIGTTTPAYQAEIYGAGQTTAALTDSGSTGGSLFLTTSDGSVGSGGALLFGARVATNNAPQAAIKLLLNNGPAQGTADLAFATRNATGDTALTERMRILSSGNIGVGTSTPQAKLSVIGNVRTGAIAGSSYTEQQSDGIYTTGTDLFLVAPASKDVHIYAGNTEKLTVLNGGNVGIGVTNPQDLLHLKAASFFLRMEKADTANYAGLRFARGATLDWFLGSREAGTGGNSAAGNDFALYNDTTAANAITVLKTNSNVGIGLTNPSYKLDVNGSANFVGSLDGSNKRIFDTGDTFLRLNQSNTFSSGIWIGTSALRMQTGLLAIGSGGGAGEVEISGTSADAVNRIKIDGNSGATSYFNAGNVGIGITNPSVKLQIQGTGSGLFGSSFYHIVTGSGTTGQGVLLGYTTETGVGGMIAGDATGGVVNNLIFGGYNGSAWGEKMRIRGDGNVGIGLTNPGFKLDVSGTMNVANTAYLGALEKGGGANDLYGWGISTGAWDTRPSGQVAYMINNHTGLTFSAHSSYGGIRFYNQSYPSITGSTLVMDINNNAVRDYGAITVDGASSFGGSSRATTIATNGMMFTDGDSGGWAFGHHALGSSGTDLGGFGFLGGANVLTYYYIGPSYSSPSMVVTSGGSVGIGVTNPSEKLQIHTGTNQNLLVLPGPTLGVADGVGFESLNDSSQAKTMAFLASSYQFALSGSFLISGGGLVVGNPTGGNKGSGSINIETDIYKNNAAYTNPDYVLEKYYTGNIVQFAANPGASTYTGVMPLDQVEAFTRANYELPRIASASGIFERGDIVLEKLEETYIHLFELNHAINGLNIDLATATSSIFALQQLASTTAMRLDTVETRLTNLESLMASSTALTISTSTPNFIASVLEVMKADIVDGVTHFVQLAVDSLSAYALTVGKTDHPAGITVYDEDTGAPFCMKVKSGMQVSTAGPCGSEPLNIQPLPTSGGSPNPSQGDTSASSTPSVDSSASSTPPVMQEAIAPDTSEPPPADASSTDSGTIATTP